MVFSKGAREKMPLGRWPGLWVKSRGLKKAAERKELEDGLTLISYLLMAMVSTLLWLVALVVSIAR